MNSAIGALSNIELLQFGGAAHSMPGAPGAAHGRHGSGRSGARKTRYALQRMQRKLMARQDFTRRFAQANRRNRKNEQREIESNANHKNDRTRHQADSRSRNEFIEICSRRGI